MWANYADTDVISDNDEEDEGFLPSLGFITSIGIIAIIGWIRRYNWRLK